MVAYRSISKGELVATYSGNVISLASLIKYKETNLRNYLFHIISGPDVQTTFVVFPKDFASIGYFMNHANSKIIKSKVNIKTLISLSRHGPIILMIAAKKIE